MHEIMDFFFYGADDVFSFSVMLRILCRFLWCSESDIVFYDVQNVTSFSMMFRMWCFPRCSECDDFYAVVNLKFFLCLYFDAILCGVETKFLLYCRRYIFPCWWYDDLLCWSDLVFYINDVPEVWSLADIVWYVNWYINHPISY